MNNKTRRKSLDFVEVDRKYLSFLHSKDSNVQLHPVGKETKYIALRIKFNNIDYLAPLTHKIPNLPKKYFIDISEGKLGSIKINCMIPCFSSKLYKKVKFDMKTPYGHLMKKQWVKINVLDKRKEIWGKVKYLYNSNKLEKDTFCCKWISLELHAKKYK